MTTEEIRSYFYVFVGREKNQTPDGSLGASNGRQRGMKGMPLDDVVSTAFNRLKERCNNEVKVFVNPVRYNELRRAFDIDQLPGFGLAHSDITNAQIKQNPKGLPQWWEIHKRAERREMLESGEFYPGIQRNIISLFANDSDEMFNFIRDLHTANMDGGISKVMDRVTALLKDKDIKKAGELISKVKKFIW